MPDASSILGLGSCLFLLLCSPLALLSLVSIVPFSYAFVVCMDRHSILTVEHRRGMLDFDYDHVN